MFEFTRIFCRFSHCLFDLYSYVSFREKKSETQCSQTVIQLSHNDYNYQWHFYEYIFVKHFVYKTAQFIDSWFRIVIRYNEKTYNHTKRPLSYEQ